MSTLVSFLDLFAQKARETIAATMAEAEAAVVIAPVALALEEMI